MNRSCLLVLLATPSLALAQEPLRDLRLVYEMPVEALQRTLHGRPDLNVEQLLAETVATIRTRVGNLAEVARDSATTFTVEANGVDAAGFRRLKARIQAIGGFEMRVVARDDYAAPGVEFSLAEERKRLRAWLAAGGRQKLRKSPRAIDEFHADENGGPLARGHLRWFVFRLRPVPGSPDHWNRPMSEVRQVQAVAAFSNEDWNDRRVPDHIKALPAEQQFLIELVPVNMHEQHFCHRDLDPSRTRVLQGGDSRFGVGYSLLAPRAAAYADWSERYIDHAVACLWGGEVRSTPIFMSRIRGVGQFHDNWTADQAEHVAAALCTPAIPARPKLLRVEER